MNSIQQLNATERDSSKKSETKKIRREGKIPAICYGGEENLYFSVQRKEFLKLFREVQEHIPFELLIQGSKKLHQKKVLVKDYQIDPIHKTIWHIDFIELQEDKPVKTNIPIHLQGQPKGIQLGGILEQKLSKLLIRSFVKEIPQKLEIGIESLDVGDFIYVRDLKLSDSVVVLTSSEQVVARVSTSRITRLVESEENKDK